MFALVDTVAGTVLQKPNSLQARFSLPNGNTVDWPHVGYTNGPYKFFEIQINTSGSGTVVSDAPPFYNAGAGTVTIARTLSNPPPPTVLTYGAFTARFTEGELDAATNYVYAVNTTTGAPLRPRLQQAIARATANDRVDLTSPTTASFLDDLIAGGVITSQRKTEILTP